jgi:hypothetical protein
MLIEHPLRRVGRINLDEILAAGRGDYVDFLRQFLAENLTFLWFICKSSYKRSGLSALS